MSTIIVDSAIATLVSNCITLKSELQALATDLDEGRIPTVMGSGCVNTARMTDSELRAIVNSDQGLETALTESPFQPANVRQAIKKMLEQFETKTAHRTVSVAQEEIIFFFNLKPFLLV